MHEFFTDLLGLLLVGMAAGCGFAAGSCFWGDPGGIVGLAAGALWGFRLAENFSRLMKTESVGAAGRMSEENLALFSQPRRGYTSDPKPSWLQRLWKRSNTRPSIAEPENSVSFEEIHANLRAINSRIWKELRYGTLSACHARLYTVQLQEGGESLDWREVNRRTVSSLHRFETSRTDEERQNSLREILDRIGQKLLIVQEVAAQKGNRLNRDEEEEFQRSESELWRLSRLLRSCSAREHETES